MRTIINDGDIFGRSITNNNSITTLIDGEATEVISVGATTETSINISMKTNTTEDTTGDNDDIMLIADNATGKVIKYIKLKNITPYTATNPIVISETNDISLKDIDGYDNGKFLKSGESGLSWGEPTDTIYSGILPIVINGSNQISLKDIDGYDNGKFLKSGESGLSWGEPTDTLYTATSPLVISGSNVISLKNLSGYGSSGQFLKTNGTDTISWDTPTNTTYTATDPIVISGGNVISLKNLSGYGSSGQFLKTNGTDTISWDTPTDTNHWTIFDTRKIKPSTSSINYLFLENTAADNSLNPAIQLKSSNSSSYIYNEYTNTALTLEQGDYKLRIKNNGNFEFSESNSVFFTIKPSTAMNLSQFINNVDFITSTSTSTFTNKSGNISQWTNDSGYITSASGAITTAENVSTAIVSGNPLRTFGNSLSSTRINGFDVSIDTLKTQSTSNFGIIFDYWTGSTYAAGKSIKPIDYGDGIILYELHHPIITGDTGVPSRIGFRDLNLSHYLFLDVPDITSDIAITLPSSAGTLALTSQIPSSLTGGTNITIIDGAVNLDQNLVGLSDTETNGAYFLGNSAASGGYIYYTHSTTRSGTNSDKSWGCYMGLTGDFHWEFNSSTSAYQLKGYIGITPSSGSYVQMNFTGQHRCIVENQSILNNIDDYVGMVVCSTGNYNVIVPEGEDTEQINIDDAQPIVELSNSAKDKRVYGVISNKEKVGERRNFGAGLFMSVCNEVITIPRLIINSIGEGGIKVCNQGGHIYNGDLLCSSDIEGLAMKQDDDLVRNYTIGKSTQDYIFEHVNDYKLIGCVYYCG